MKNSRDLPPLLRVVSILGLLIPLAGLAIYGVAFVARGFSFPQSPLGSVRLGVIATSSMALSLACTSAVGTYRARFRQPGRRPFPLNSWQSRLRVIAVVAVLSSCTLVLAVGLPPTAVAFVYVLPISNLVALGVIVATLGMNLGR